MLCQNLYFTYLLISTFSVTVSERFISLHTEFHGLNDSPDVLRQLIELR